MLEELGWEINPKKVLAPQINHFMNQDSMLFDILGKYAVTSQPQDLQVPDFA